MDKFFPRKTKLPLVVRMPKREHGTRQEGESCLCMFMTSQIERFVNAW